jgi:hypothetical protein
MNKNSIDMKNLVQFQECKDYRRGNGEECGSDERKKGSIHISIKDRIWSRLIRQY